MKNKVMYKNTLDDLRQAYQIYLKNIVDDYTAYPAWKIRAAIYIGLCLATKEEIAKALDAVTRERIAIKNTNNDRGGTI